MILQATLAITRLLKTHFDDLAATFEPINMSGWTSMMRGGQISVRCLSYLQVCPVNAWGNLSLASCNRSDALLARLDRCGDLEGIARCRNTVIQEHCTLLAQPNISWPDKGLTPGDDDPEKVHQEVVAPEVVYFRSRVGDSMEVFIERAGSIVQKKTV